MAKNGYNVHLVITADADVVVDGVNIHALKPASSRLQRMLCRPFAAMKKALSTKAGLYHYHDPELLPVGFMLRWLFGKKVIFDVHEDIPGHLKSKEYLPKPFRGIISLFYKLIEKTLLCGQNIIVANQNCIMNYPGRAVLVQNYPEDIGNEFEGRLDDKFAGDKSTLVYFGAVEAGRGAQIYLELANRLKQSGRRFKLTIIGQYSQALGRQMQEYIKANHLDECVELTGRMNWQEAMKIVSESSIGLCVLLPEPNYTSCLATKILEYMMAGTPVLASDFDNWRLYVKDTGSGRMVDPKNIEQVFSTCCEMLDDRQSLKNMAQAGRNAITEKYNWDSEFSKMKNLYEHCLS